MVWEKNIFNNLPQTKALIPCKWGVNPQRSMATVMLFYSTASLILPVSLSLSAGNTSKQEMRVRTPSDNDSMWNQISHSWKVLPPLKTWKNQVSRASMTTWFSSTAQVGAEPLDKAPTSGPCLGRDWRHEVRYVPQKPRPNLSLLSLGCKQAGYNSFCILFLVQTILF